MTPLETETARAARHFDYQRRLTALGPGRPPEGRVEMALKLYYESKLESLAPCSPWSPRRRSTGRPRGPNYKPRAPKREIPTSVLDDLRGCMTRGRVRARVLARLVEALDAGSVTGGQVLEVLTPYYQAMLRKDRTIFNRRFIAAKIDLMRALARVGSDVSMIAAAFASAPATVESFLAAGSWERS